MRFRFLVGAVSLPLLAACSSDRSTAPDKDGTLSVSRSGANTALACDAQAAKYAALDFFASRQDPVFPILKAQAKAAWYGKSALATELGFDALREMAAARGTDRQEGSGADGEALSREIVGCMAVGALPDDADIAAAIDRGIFEVRGGQGDAGAAALAFTATPGMRQPPPTTWGIEASMGWAASYKGAPSRYLVYGWPRTVSDFTDEVAARDPFDVAYTGFELTTHPATPALVLADPLRPGICAELQDGVVPNRLLHGEDDSPVVLALSPLEFCDDPVSTVSGAPGLAKRLAAFLAPRPAHAFFRGGVGGLTSSLSPFGAVQVDMNAAGFTYTVQPTASGQVPPSKVPLGEPFTLQTRLTTAAGTPVEGASVRVTVHLNRGEPVVLEGDNPVLTDDDGRATFTLTLTKPGGYRLIAVATLGAMSTDPIISELFTMEP